MWITGVCEQTTPFGWALALQPLCRNCYPAPDLVLWKPILLIHFVSWGVFFSQTPVWGLSWSHPVRHETPGRIGTQHGIMQRSGTVTPVCRYACIRMYVCTYAWIRMCRCTHVRTYVCMYVCMYVCICTYACVMTVHMQVHINGSPSTRKANVELKGPLIKYFLLFFLY